MKVIWLGEETKILFNFKSKQNKWVNSAVTNVQLHLCINLHNNITCHAHFFRPLTHWLFPKVRVQFDKGILNVYKTKLWPLCVYLIIFPFIWYSNVWIGINLFNKQLFSKLSMYDRLVMTNCIHIGLSGYQHAFLTSFDKKLSWWYNSSWKYPLTTQYPNYLLVLVMMHFYDLWAYWWFLRIIQKKKLICWINHWKVLRIAPSQH